MIGVESAQSLSTTSRLRAGMRRRLVRRLPVRVLDSIVDERRMAVAASWIAGSAAVAAVTMISR
jgi:hypothetical protein